MWNHTLKHKLRKPLNDMTAKRKHSKSVLSSNVSGNEHFRFIYCIYTLYINGKINKWTS